MTTIDLMAGATVETICKPQIELLPHPSYSQNPVPSDYDIFEPLRDVSHGFACN
jgi:hypothetical protein